MEHLEVVKNSYKLVRAFRVELDLEALVFRERRKTGASRENPLGREQTTNLPFHIPET